MDKVTASRKSRILEERQPLGPWRTAHYLRQFLSYQPPKKELIRLETRRLIFEKVSTFAKPPWTLADAKQHLGLNDEFKPLALEVE
jgi:hypothetical protein